MFEPYRHTAQVEGRPPSIGLGLTVGRKLAQLMGGDLSFVPCEGWSVFRLELPTASPARAEGFGIDADSTSVGSRAGALDGAELAAVDADAATVAVDAAAM